MFLALDIGNTAVKAALFTPDGALAHAARMAQSDETEALEALLREAEITRAGLASVAPDRTARLKALLQERLGRPPFQVRATAPLPFRMAYATPETLGADRVAAAAGALAHVGPGRPMVVVDAGTAVTYEVLSAEPAYLGGAIAPGPTLMAQSLARGTAQLPEVPLKLPPSPIGTSTVEAIQSGVLHGFAEGVRGTLGRMIPLLEAAPVVLATGGWGAWLAGHVPAITLVRPHLVLEGVRALALADAPAAA